AFAVAMRAPKFFRPRICRSPRVDDAARLGVLDVDVIADCHRLKRADCARESTAQDYNLADLALRLRYRAHVFVEDIACGDDVTVRQRWIAVIGAKDVEDSFSAFRGSKPRQNSRLNCAPV